MCIKAGSVGCGSTDVSACATAPRDEKEEEFIDLTGDGGVRKKILRFAPADSRKPENGHDVTVHYTGYLLDTNEKFDSSVDRNQPFSFVLGKGSVIQGWEVGVASMLIGENAKFIIQSKYAYGELGNTDHIPPNATLVFDIELIDSKTKKKENWEYTVEEKMAMGIEDKNAGNQALRKQDFADAIVHYRNIVDLMVPSDVDFYDGDNVTFKADYIDLIKSVYLNLALAYIKTEQYNEAFNFAGDALKIDPTNCKGLFRRGISAMHTGELKLSKEDLSMVDKLEGGKNVDVKKALEKWKELHREELLRHKKMYGSMFKDVGRGYSDGREKISKVNDPANKGCCSTNSCSSTCCQLDGTCEDERCNANCDPN